MIFAGETEVLGENLPSATLSTTNHTWIDPGANPGLRGERPATNRLSHGTARYFTYSSGLNLCYCDDIFVVSFRLMPSSSKSSHTFHDNHFTLFDANFYR
jgi:hypothetical protein